MVTTPLPASSTQMGRPLWERYFAVLWVGDFALRAALRWEASSGQDARGLASPLGGAVAEADCAFLEKAHLPGRVDRKLPPAASAARVAAVVVDDRQRVAELTEAARRAGVAEGMTLPKALARCAELRVLEATEAALRSAERLLWVAAWQVTPQIEVTAPGWLTLQIHPAQLDPAVAALQAALPRLAAEGLPTRAGLAETPALAILAARAGATDRLKFIPSPERRLALLEALPLAAGGFPPAWVDILAGWGLRNLGQVARLPRQDLAERLGAMALEHWDDLNARRCRPLTVTSWSPQFLESCDLETPVEVLQSLLFWQQRALESLAAQLRTAAQVARSVTIRLEVEDGSPYQHRIRLPEPTTDPQLLQRLLQHHLENLRLAGAVRRFEIRLEAIAPTARQAGLFSSQIRHPWQLAETLDELAGLLGAENVGCPGVCKTHRDDCFDLVPLLDELPPFIEDSPEMMDAFDDPGSARFFTLLRAEDDATLGLFEVNPLTTDRSDHDNDNAGKETRFPPDSRGEASAGATTETAGHRFDASPEPAGATWSFWRDRPAVATAELAGAGVVVSGPVLRRFRPAMPADVRIAAPQSVQPQLPGFAQLTPEPQPPLALGEPVEVSSGIASGPVVAFRGPFLTSGDWWSEEPWRAEEWDVELPAQGCFRLRCNREHWELLGVWD